ncbi:MAG TPA: hypothetical protein PLV96_08980 [Methanoregulaceae archaeon]|nr:hypothetical protein [Methanoregulaceae archaeon]
MRCGRSVFTNEGCIRTAPEPPEIRVIPMNGTCLACSNDERPEAIG